MILDILPLAGGTARLVRVYGGEPCVKLPGAVPAPEGEGQWPITELGDYCFSCLLYTSDAANEEDSVDVGGGRSITTKTKKTSLIVS